MGAEGARGRGGLRDQPGAVAAGNENRIIQASFGSARQRYGLTPCSARAANVRKLLRQAKGQAVTKSA